MVESVVAVDLLRASNMFTQDHPLYSDNLDIHDIRTPLSTNQRHTLERLDLEPLLLQGLESRGGRNFGNTRLGHSSSKANLTGRTVSPIRTKAFE